jgi:hypothetical protein
MFTSTFGFNVQNNFNSRNKTTEKFTIILDFYLPTREKKLHRLILPQIWRRISQVIGYERIYSICPLKLILSSTSLEEQTPLNVAPVDIPLHWNIPLTYISRGSVCLCLCLSVCLSWRRLHFSPLLRRLTCIRSIGNPDSSQTTNPTKLSPTSPQFLPSAVLGDDELKLGTRGCRSLIGNMQRRYKLYHLRLLQA